MTSEITRDTLVPAKRTAITAAIHAVCWDRNLDSHSTVDTEAHCRIEQLLPEVIALAKAVGPYDLATFESALPRTICLQCGNQDALGRCPIRAEADCCLYRYLPLLYDAIHRAEGWVDDHTASSWGGE